MQVNRSTYRERASRIDVRRSNASVDILLVGPELMYQQLAHQALYLLRERGQNVPAMSNVPSFEDLYSSDGKWEWLPPFRPDPNELATYMHSSGIYTQSKPLAMAR